VDFRIIKSPSQSTKDILIRRIGGNCKTKLDGVDAIGLVQGKLIDMIYATDIAEKSAGVTVEDIKGTCPQHMVLIGIFGDTSSVESAINEIKLNMIVARLIDNVWATRKAESLNGLKFMLAEEIGGVDEGRRFIVVDNISAGIGDRVIVSTGSSARRMLGDDNIPVDAVVVGIVDNDCNFG